MKRDEHPSFATELKDFVSRGNVIHLALAVMIGATFGKIVDPLLKDLMLPLAGKVLGGLDFAHLLITLSSQRIERHGPVIRGALTKAGVLRFAFGSFIAAAFDFLVLAPIIFMWVKQINRMQAAVPPAPSAPTAEDVALLREIRDVLKKSSRARDRMGPSIRPILPGASRTTL